MALPAFPGLSRLKRKDEADRELAIFNWKPTVSASENGIDWSAARVLIRGPGARAYVKFVSDGTDKIHFAFTDGHPRNEPTNSIYYACYYQRTLFRADGTRMKDWKDLPIVPLEADKVYDGKVNGARAWIWDIAIDGSGSPVIAYTALPEETDHRYRYARWRGTQWEDHEITAAGRWFPETPQGAKEREPHYSGGIALDPRNPSIVYLSRPVEAVFEIEKWTNSDGGKTSKSEPITSLSALAGGCLTFQLLRQVVIDGLNDEQEIPIQRAVSFATSVALVAWK